jgi:hypothetical protein
MAMLINTAVVTILDMVETMINPNSNYSLRPGEHAQNRVAALFSANDWKVHREPAIGQSQADLLVKKGHQAFLIEVKTASEGRPDRVIPLLSHAILQAQAYARERGQARPLAIVYVADASPSLLSQVSEFSRDFAPDVAIGVVSESGVRHFVGGGLEALNIEPSVASKKLAKSPRRAFRLFSDLNQWMLKVLLAPEIPERLLKAPRAEYRNVSALAAAADVSLMSASRFAQQLREEGFLDESSPRFKIVRRTELFRRWSSIAIRSPELPMRFLIRGSVREQLREIGLKHQVCVALFAAADALKLGHIEGVPPYIYVPTLPRLTQDMWKELVPASPGERPDLILRQALAPQSVFRGAVHIDGVAVSDVLQIWLDVSVHPSRGEEQSRLIERKALGKVFERDTSERL